MTDIAIEPPRAHARIVYLGPVSPHWEIYFDHGDRTVIDEFRARALARLVLFTHSNNAVADTDDLQRKHGEEHEGRANRAA